MNLRPIGTQILVKLLKQDNDAPVNGLYLPKSIRDDGPTEAEVVALGSGLDSNGNVVEFNVKVGDRVLLPRYAEGVVVKHDDDVYSVMREDGILGIVE